MQTLSLPHPTNAGTVKRFSAVVIAAAILIAVLVVALVNVGGSGGGAPAAPAAHHAGNPAPASVTHCMYLDQPC